MNSTPANFEDEYEEDARNSMLGYDELNDSRGKIVQLVDSRSRVWSRANAPLLLGAFSVSFFTACLVSLAGPFLPAEMRKLGASDSTVGVTFAVYPLALFVCSPVACWLCIKFGHPRVIFVGVLLEGGMAVLSAFFVQLAPTDFTRVALLIALRLLQGVGGALSYTAICARLADRYPHNLGEVMGLQESIGGVGFTLGPVVGALLYNWGGFSLPFLVTGGLVLCTLLIIPAAMRDPPTIDFVIEDEYGEDTATEDDSPYRPLRGSSTDTNRSHNNVFVDNLDSEAKPPTCWGLCTDVSVLTGFSVTVLSGIGIGFVVPTLQSHLYKLLAVDTVVVGLMFGLIAATYIASSAVSGWAGDRYGHRSVMIVGLLLLTVCYLLIGPAPFLSSLLPSLPWVMWTTQVVALAGIGIGVGLALVPAMPHMLLGIRAKGANNPGELSASLFSSAYSLGEGLGPLLGGVMAQVMGFEWAAVVVACSQLVLALVLLLEAAVNGHKE